MLLNLTKWYICQTEPNQRFSTCVKPICKQAKQAKYKNDSIVQEKNNKLLVALVDVLASLDSKKKLKNLLKAQSAEEAMMEIQGR